MSDAARLTRFGRPAQQSRQRSWRIRVPLLGAKDGSQLTELDRCGHLTDQGKHAPPHPESAYVHAPHIRWGSGEGCRDGQVWRFARDVGLQRQVLSLRMARLRSLSGENESRCEICVKNVAPDLRQIRR